MTTTHYSPFAGSWYPETAPELERLLADAFEESRRRTGPHVLPDALAYVVPHAGPAYSGTVAAAVYRAIERQQPEQIVVLAFPHRGRLRGVAAPDLDSIATPLGETAVDAGDFPRVAEDRVCDHSFEIQLPFLQKASPRSRITPLYVGDLSGEERREWAARLAAHWRPGVVFLASSDFTHYGRSFRFVPFPVDRTTGARLKDLDYQCMDALGSLDAGLFLDALAETGATVCGAAPLALLAETLQALGAGDIYQATLDYRTSGEITGDFEHSVSYAALSYHRKSAFELGAEDCAALLDSAGATLGTLRETGRREAAEARGSEALQARLGAFVTLHRGSELLGCIGDPHGGEPLAKSVGELALSAALDDPRFRPATETSGPIDLEISVLTPFRRIRDAGGFAVGRHGGIIRFGPRVGLLLPQVATDRGWTKPEEFLSALMRKSGMAKDAWRHPDARLSVFEAQVFSRPGLPGRS
jgi:MEMO1 family protein